MKVYSVSGIYQNYNADEELLSLKLNDTIVFFSTNKLFLDSESASIIKNNYNNWNKSIESILKLNFFIDIYFDYSTNKINHTLNCIHIEEIDSLASGASFNIPTYDTKIYNLSGILNSVELGDYLHIQIINNLKAKNLWVHSAMDTSTLNKLYDLEGSNLNIPIELKYFKDVSWIPEYGKPLLHETCISIVFEK